MGYVTVSHVSQGQKTLFENSEQQDNGTTITKK